MMELKIVRDDSHVGIVSPFWRVMHDLAQGGTISDVRITHASNRNLLRKPVSSAVDSYSESREDKPRLSIRESGNKVVLTFSGFMRDSAGRDCGIRYEHKYVYCLYYIRNELRLIPSGTTSVHTVTACSAEVDGALDEYAWGSTDFEKEKDTAKGAQSLWPYHDDVWGDFHKSKGVLFSETRRPHQISIFSRGREGLSWVGDSRQYAWDTPLAATTLACFTLERLDDSSRITLSPIKTGAGRKGVGIGQPLEFAWYLILPNVGEKGKRKLFPAFIGSNPFPCDGEIKAMAKSGVNVIAFMDDVDYRYRTVHHWHDGEFPPYPPEKMREMSRFLKLCHSCDMAVLPYFNGRILSPETPAFAKHAREWYVPGFPDGQLRYHPWAGAGTMGSFMCPDSGWINFLEGYIKRCVGELGFDGYYLDYATPGPCYNTRHLPGEHNMTDGLTTLIENLKGWLGNDRLMIAHCGGGDCWLFLHNIADGIVTLEEAGGGKEFHRLEDYPPSVSFMGSGSVSLVPNVYFYRPGCKEKKQLLHEGVAHAALLNTVVYPYTFWYDSNFGYENWREAFSDPDGLYAMYKRLKDIDFTQYKFFDPRSGVAQSNRKNVVAAVYVGEKDAIVVAGNFGDEPVPGATVSLRMPGKTGVIEKTVKIGPLRKSGVEFKKLKWR